MARKVDKMPGSNTPASKYPWNEWLDGNTWELTRGQDFDTPPADMARYVRNKMYQRRLKGHVRCVRDKVYIQAIRATDTGGAS